MSAIFLLFISFFSISIFNTISDPFQIFFVFFANGLFYLFEHIFFTFIWEFHQGAFNEWPLAFWNNFRIVNQIVAIYYWQTNFLETLCPNILATLMEWSNLIDLTELHLVWLERRNEHWKLYNYTRGVLGFEKNYRKQDISYHHS
jgi:hypothetical protein